MGASTEKGDRNSPLSPERCAIDYSPGKRKIRQFFSGIEREKVTVVTSPCHLPPGMATRAIFDIVLPTFSAQHGSSA